MITSETYTKISKLPHSIQDELNDYMEFLVSKYNKNKHPKAGCMKGTFIMKSDFNEPIEDFKEYM